MSAAGLPVLAEATAREVEEVSAEIQGGQSESEWRAIVCIKLTWDWESGDDERREGDADDVGEAHIDWLGTRRRLRERLGLRPASGGRGKDVDRCSHFFLVGGFIYPWQGLPSGLPSGLDRSQVGHISGVVSPHGPCCPSSFIPANSAGS